MANNARPRLSAQEKQWRAQDDVRTLQNAQQIKTDSARMTAAAAEAKRQENALKQIANQKKSR